MKCPICFSLNNEIVYRHKNVYFTFSDARFDIIINLCRNCGFIFQSSAYSHSYDKIMSETYSIYRRDEKYPFPNRKKDNLDALSIITENLSQEKFLNVLEIGSNRGDLLYMIKEKIPQANVIGIEPAKFKNLKVPIINTFFESKLFSNKFQVIIMQHVFEHIKYPKKMISDIMEILADKGILYIEVPNTENSLKYCLDDFVPEHVNFFTSFSISFLLEHFDIIQLKATSHLMLILKLKNKGREKPSNYRFAEPKDIAEMFEIFSRKKSEIRNTILQCSSSGEKLVFYGVSYYFRFLFKQFQDYLDSKKCFYFDDSYLEKKENTFGLRRLEKFDNNCAVIICSTVLDIQEKIEKKTL